MTTDPMHRPPPALALALLALSACGSDTPGAPPAATRASVPARPAARAPKPTVTPVPAAPAPPPFEPLSLLPADTVAVLRVSSMTALDEAILKFGAIAERAGAPVAVREELKLWFGQAGVDWGALRQREPLVLAVRMPAGAGEPKFVAFVPVSEAGPSNGLATLTEVDGDYVAVTRSGDQLPVAAPPLWCDDVPDGLLHVRVDVRALVSRFGPLLPVALERAMSSEGLPPELSEEVARQRAQLLALAQSVRALDLGVALDLGKLGLSAELELEGGPLVAGVSQRGNAVAKLAQHLATDVPIAGAVAFDLDNAAQAGTEELEASLAGLPEAVRAPLTRLHAASVAFLRAFEPGAVALVDPTPGSMHMALVLRCEDAKRSRDALGRLLASIDFDALGFDVSLPERSRVGSAVVEDFTIRFDSRRLDFRARAEMRRAFESFLGSEALHLFVASSGPEVMLMLGGETTATRGRLRAFSKPDGVPAELTTGLAAVGSTNPGSLWRVDATRLATLGAEFAAAAGGGSAAAARREALRAQPDLGSVPLVFWGGARADRAFGGLEVDLDALERAAQLLPPR